MPIPSRRQDVHVARRAFPELRRRRRRLGVGGSLRFRHLDAMLPHEVVHTHVNGVLTMLLPLALWHQLAARLALRPFTRRFVVFDSLLVPLPDDVRLPIHALHLGIAQLAQHLKAFHIDAVGGARTHVQSCATMRRWLQF